MKKFLLLTVLGIATVQFVNSQVIELIGKGVFEKTELTDLTLEIPDPYSVESVVVVAAATFLNFSVPQNIFFSDIEENIEVEFVATSPNITTTYVESLISNGQNTYGYYTAKLSTVPADGKITLGSNGQENHIKSFTAYITRKGPSPGIYSEVLGPHAFLFSKGSNFPLEYTFTIPESDFPRDVVVSIPFTDLGSNDTRPANVIVSAGDITQSSEFDINNAGDLLHFETITLPNVPSDVLAVTVKVFSQRLSIGEKEGDSFITGPTLLTTTFEEYDPVCTLTQGYWKTHSKYGPASKPNATWDEVGGPDADFYLSNQSWIEVFKTSVRGNSYYQLAHQYMAAYLNMLNGAMVPSEVAEAMTRAEVIFGDKEPGYFAKVRGKTQATKDQVSEMVSLASILASYNKGIITLGHCGKKYQEKSAEVNIDIDLQISEFSVYPNPVLNRSTISFMPAYDGLATVELYNSLGQKASRLLHQSVIKDIPVSFTFSGLEFEEGLYILIMQNGEYRESAKIQISR